jgi:PilZ domain
MIDEEDPPEESVVELLDELLMMEMLRGQRELEPEEARRWVELQRILTRELCDTPVAVDERRQYLRVATPLLVWVVSPGASFQATALDLGAGGMGLSAGVLPFPGENVVLEWARSPVSPSDQFRLDLPARVMWMRKATHELGPGFGVAFQPAHRDHDRAISELLLMLLRHERNARSGSG